MTPAPESGQAAIHHRRAFEPPAPSPERTSAFSLRSPESGYIVRHGVGHVAKLVEIVADSASDLPAEARPVLAVISQGLQALKAQIALLDREIAGRAKADPVAKRLMTIPGVSPVTATALVALAPAASTFRRGRDFAAWLGLVPRQGTAGPYDQNERAQPTTAADLGGKFGNKGRGAQAR